MILTGVLRGLAGIKLSVLPMRLSISIKHKRAPIKQAIDNRKE